MKRVLVVHNNDLLVAGVESMLTRENGLDVKGTTFLSRNALIQEIEHFLPHVILVDYCLQLSEIVSVLCSMNGFQDIRVAIINVENNYVTIFEKYQVEVRQGKDFLKALLFGVNKT